MSKWRESDPEEDCLDTDTDSGDEDEAGFVIKVQTIMGSAFHVFAYPSDTVDLLKTRIAFQEGIPPSDQNLVLGKRTLDDPTTLLSDLGLRDDSVLKIITNISSGLPYKRVDLSPPPPLTLRKTTTTDSSSELKLPRLTADNQVVDGVFVLRDKNDRRIFLIVKRSTVDRDSEESACEETSGGHTPPITISRRKMTRSGRDVHLERIRENAKTLKTMSHLRQTLCQRKRRDADFELPKIRPPLEAKPPPPPGPPLALQSRTVNSSIASLNRLKAEIYLQAKKEDFFPGSPPYSHTQLWRYTQLKVNILINQDQDDPHPSRFLRSPHTLTPTVVTNRKQWQKKSGRKTGRESTGSKSKENVIHLSSSNQSLEGAAPPYHPRVSTGRKSARLLLSRPGTASSIKKKKLVVRCQECKKRIGIACRYHCRCGLTYCTTHRYPEAHKCTFDYKEEGRRVIAAANPLVVPTKVPEI